MNGFVVGTLTGLLIKAAASHFRVTLLINITGLQPVIIETNMCGDELRTDLTAMERQMATLGAENIACVLTTTSCFAPRASDSVEQVAVLCSRYNIPHLINNAYGLQSSRCMHLIQEAAR
jgi:O-phospho-L-seryl-tRNASec:L-selenocysteinyl-tRNA synthase